MITQATVIKPATSTQERQLITIEFSPQIHPSETQYTYEHPQFVFGNRVELINEYPKAEYTICALELIESKTLSGKLLNQPRWKYKISNEEQTYWKDESAICRANSPSTCSTCSQFKDLHRKNGSGLCQLSGQSVRKHHASSNDCILRGASWRCSNEGYSLRKNLSFK